MEPRIILTQADFSANNIGRYIVLSDLTKKVLAKQTQYDEDSAEAIALNTFLTSLTSGGFIGGDNPLLKALFIPALASQHSELFYNIAKLDGNGYPTNEMPSAEASATDKVYSLLKDDSNRVVGIHAVRGSLSAEAFKAQTTFNNEFGLTSEALTLPNVSVIEYELNDRTSISAEDKDISLFDGMMHIGPRALKVFKSGNRIGYTATGSGLGFIGFTLNNSTYQFNASADNLILTSDGTLTGEVVANDETKDDAYIGVSASIEKRQTKFSLVAWGEDIFDDRMTTLKSLVDAFMTAIHVKSFITA